MWRKLLIVVFGLASALTLAVAPAVAEKPVLRDVANTAARPATVL